MMGVVMFGVITIAMRLSNEGLGPAEIREAQNEENNQVEQKQSLPGLFLVLICFTGGALIGRFVVLGVLDRQLENEFSQDRESPLRTGDFLGRYQTRLIVSLALLEGTAFFALIVFMIEGRWEAFGLAGLLLMIMGMNFPTETKFNHWVETARLNARTTIGD